MLILGPIYSHLDHLADSIFGFKDEHGTNNSNDQINPKCPKKKSTWQSLKSQLWLKRFSSMESKWQYQTNWDLTSNIHGDTKDRTNMIIYFYWQRMPLCGFLKWGYPVIMGFSTRMIIQDLDDLWYAYLRTQSYLCYFLHSFSWQCPELGSPPSMWKGGPFETEFSKELIEGKDHPT